MFRWRQEPSGAWVGADGDHVYRVTIDANLLQVETTATREEFDLLFRLDWDGNAIVTEILDRGPELKPLVLQLPGLRVMRPSDPVETLVSFLCTPNNNVGRITNMVRHLALHGADMGAYGLHRFPTLEMVASLPERELRAHGFGYRAATIPKGALHVLDCGGRAWLESLKNVPYHEAHAALMGIPGIGPKLADCIALFALHHTLAVPVDTHLWQAVVRLYRPDWVGKSLTASRYREIGDMMRGRFGALAGWAHQFLFYENLLNWKQTHRRR